MTGRAEGEEGPKHLERNKPWPEPSIPARRIKLKKRAINTADHMQAKHHEQFFLISILINNQPQWRLRSQLQGGLAFSSPEPTILLACGRDRELWPDPIF